MNTKFLCSMLLVTLACSSTVSAEFKYADAATQQGEPVDGDKKRMHHESILGASDDINKSAQFDKSRLLRCWQEGELIVAENGWNLIDKDGQALMHKSSKNGSKKTMSVYDYGETFCMYLGG